MAFKTKVLGQVNTNGLTQNSVKLVNTATLIRGRVYFFKEQRFDVGIPEIVTDVVASVLEELHQEIVADNERFEKPFFDVRRQVKPPVKLSERDGKPPIRRLPPIQQSTIARR